MNIFNKIVALENEAKDFGFQWENSQQIMQQILSEVAEIQEHLKAEGVRNQGELQVEIGDLLHAVFSLTVFCQLNPEQTLQQSVAKFERRLNAVQRISLEQGMTDLKGYTFEALMDIWNKAKKAVG